jgi:hypothetical protein
MNLNQDEASDFAALDPFGKDADIGESMSNLHEKEPDD